MIISETLKDVTLSVTTDKPAVKGATHRGLLYVSDDGSIANFEGDVSGIKNVIIYKGKLLTVRFTPLEQCLVKAELPAGIDFESALKKEIVEAARNIKLMGGKAASLYPAEVIEEALQKATEKKAKREAALKARLQAAAKKTDKKSGKKTNTKSNKRKGRK